MLQLKGNKLTIISLIVLGILILPSLFSLFHSGLFLSDDGNWMIIRFSAFYESIKQGQFPPRFLVRLNHGYGYPVADFLYPLFMYLGVPIKIIGINFVGTIKIIFGISILSSALFSYFWLRKIFSNLSAIIGAFVYVMLPYHMYDIYTRGSIGETLALAIVPFILWQMEKRNIIFVSLGIALLILSHNSLAALYLPIVIAYAFIRKSFSLKRIVFITLYALAISAFFWIPALFDKQYTIFDKTSVSDISIYFLNLNSDVIGWVTLLILILSAFFLRKKNNILLKAFWVLNVLSLILVLPISKPLWEVSHIIPFFQFPFRFLSLSILATAFITAATIEFSPQRYKYLLFPILVIVAYLSSWTFLFPKSFQDYPDTFYSTNQDTTTVKNEYMPIWVKNQPTEYSDQKVVISKGEGVISDVNFNGSILDADVVLSTNSIVRLNIIYFPGWEIKVDNKKVDIKYDNDLGLMEFMVPSGGHWIHAKFTETPIRIFADLISVLSIAGLLVFVVKKKYDK